jgi:hypothetical protein
MKKFFFLMMFLSLALTAGAANDYRKVNNLWYLLSNDKKSAAVVASQDETSYQDALAEEVFIPDSIRVVINADTISVPVTEIHNNVFAGCSEITSATIKDQTAKLAMINDFGSEDLTATLTVKNDTLYVLKQVDGSTLKVPKNGKWQKLPTSLPFTLRQKHH